MSFTINNMAMRAAIAFSCLLLLAFSAYVLAGYLSVHPMVFAGMALEAVLVLSAVYIAVMGLVDSTIRARANRKIISALGRFADGDYSCRLEDAAGMPAGLADSFNQMAVLLGAKIQVMEGQVKGIRRRDGETVLLKEQSGRLEEELIRANSDLMRKEVMLGEINQELLAASRVKSEFIRNMGRELRTPLNSIIGLADFVNSGTLGDVNQRQKQYIGEVKDSARNLLDIVENILEYTSIEIAGTLNGGEIEIREVADEVVSSLAPLAAAHNVRLTSDVPEVRIWADARKLKFILYDLLHNAIKFNRPGGRAELTACLTNGRDDEGPLERSTGEKTFIEFRVDDTGVGFPSSDAHRLFKPFSQIAEAGRAKPKGAGLSLALVKKYVDLHNGKVWAEGRPGSGSRFSFVIPLFHSMLEQKRSKVLVVEDDPDYMKLITMYFEGEPYDIITADDGLEALKAVEEERPDLVLMDVLLPKMDGIEACKALKRQDKFEQFRHIPVIIMTSLSDVGSKVKGVQAGADDFLVKPVNKDLLIERVRSLIGSKREYECVLASYREAERDSISDALTGLYNRRYMEDVLGKEFKNAERYRKNLSVLMVDIDFFKKYNDSYGHQEGDKLLRRIAGVFREAVREVDVAARYGGEEFTIILTETPSDMAMVAAERIRCLVETTTGATVSVGAATYPEDAQNCEGLIEMADKALYKAKNAGRNRTEKFTPEQPGIPDSTPMV